MANAKVQKELQDLAEAQPNEKLKPELVVSWARDHPESALFAELQWDDAAAGESWRIEQARKLIRLVVWRLPNEPKKIRALVSVPTDRLTGGGYRQVSKVLSNSDLRAEIVVSAIKEIQSVLQRYAHLHELDNLFIDIRECISDYQITVSNKEVV